MSTTNRMGIANKNKQMNETCNVRCASPITPKTLTLAASIDVVALTHHRHMFVNNRTAIPIHSNHDCNLRRQESHNFRANINVHHARVSVSHRPVPSDQNKKWIFLFLNKNPQQIVSRRSSLTSLVSYNSMHAIMEKDIKTTRLFRMARRKRREQKKND